MIKSCQPVAAKYLFLLSILSSAVGCSKVEVAVKPKAQPGLSQIKVKYQPPPPPYPEFAKKAGIQGSVVVEILVAPNGLPSSARAVKGPPELFALVEEYAMRWTFEPPTIDGIPQPARFLVTTPFVLK